MRRRILSALVAVGLLAGGCGSSGHDSPDPSTVEESKPGAAQIGSLRIFDAYVPRPASPATAAAYFAIRNNGDEADSLQQITTPVSAMAMLHDYQAAGSGTEKMTDLDTLPVPAHRTVRLMPGKMHVMMDNPTRTLEAGQSVVLTLVFAHAGKVSIKAPVLPIGQTPEG